MDDSKKQNPQPIDFVTDLAVALDDYTARPWSPEKEWERLITAVGLMRHENEKLRRANERSA